MIVDSLETLEARMAEVREAQRKFALYTQEEVDRIFLAAATAANRARIPLAKAAVEETGMGVLEDKIFKNHFAAEYIYNYYKNVKTCGVIEEDREFGTQKIAEPVGVIAAVIPTTNPTSTAIFKTLLALKTRNGMIISPHPRAKNSTILAAKTILDAAVAAGAPEGIIAWIDVPSLELTNAVMRGADLILATGGPGMVKAAYSSGKPALGVGAGNTPAVIDESADVLVAVNSIIHSKTFDNGMICASEQSVIAVDAIYDKVRAEFAAPEGVDMGEFSRGYGDYGGWVSAETAFGGYGSGSLNVTAPAASVTALASDRFDTTEDGLSGGYFLANHRWYDGPQPAAELGEGAYVCREYADLYVGADFEALWQQGLDVDFETMSFQSDYHTVFLTRPESPVVWKLSLAANMFTREDVLALAESFVWPN